MKRGWLIVAAVSTGLAAGCAQAVSLDPPAPEGAAATACQALSKKLPATIEGLARTETDPVSPYTAVWGPGEIALRCGVGRPASMEPTAEVSDVNGVGWFADPARPTLFTTVNREAYVEVTISANHQPGSVLVDLADPIKATIP